ncbi:MAG TPA: ABC transporter substrate-binding protein, partial [Xanthobacteraceae bacterium]
MRRRDFITLLGGAAAAWPFAGQAQQARSPVVGFLSTLPIRDSLNAAEFRNGLKDLGYVEGQNVEIDIRVSN